MNRISECFSLLNCTILAAGYEQERAQKCIHKSLRCAEVQKLLVSYETQEYSYNIARGCNAMNVEYMLLSADLPALDRNLYQPSHILFRLLFGAIHNALKRIYFFRRSLERVEFENMAVFRGYSYERR